MVLFSRDHFLATARGLSKDQVISLRTGPFLDVRGIFNEKMLAEINVANRDALNARAMSRLASVRLFKAGYNGGRKDQKSQPQRSNNFPGHRGARTPGLSRGGYVGPQPSLLTNTSHPLVGSNPYDWSEEKCKLKELQRRPVGCCTRLICGSRSGLPIRCAFGFAEVTDCLSCRG